MKYTLINIREKIKGFLKKFKKFPKLYSKILYVAVVLAKFKRIMQYGNNSVFSCKITKKRRAFETSYAFDKDVKFSVLVPLYNTPKRFLKEMILSVKNQTYGNFELCLADGSDLQHNYVEEYCVKLAKTDPRIKYKKLIENKGISENTNECIKMASGDYIALFDHDDILHPSALFECMKAICEQDADYIYTDEVTFLGKNVKNIISFHFKPDFAPYNLLANNYICHFSVFKTSLIDKVGAFRHQYDGSQDHDIILRLTDAAENVVHIPRILYFWRSHSNSVAMDINSKPYAIKSGQSAVRDFLASKGFNTVVESSPAFPTVYRITYEIVGNPLVSIIINNSDDVKKLDESIKAILQNTSYDNYEIIIAHTATGDDNALNCYGDLKLKYDVISEICTEGDTCSVNSNSAAKAAKGEYLLFVDSSLMPTTADWIQELLMYAQRTDVGAVGGKLLKDGNIVVHAGMILGLGKDRVAAFSHEGADETNLGYMGKLFYAQNISAVTSKCLMVKKESYDLVGGFDELFGFKYYDVDFCLRLSDKGFTNVFNPFCALKFEECGCCENDTDATREDTFAFKNRWNDVIKGGDPYYNPNLSLDNSYFFDFDKKH